VHWSPLEVVDKWKAEAPSSSEAAARRAAAESTPAAQAAGALPTAQVEGVVGAAGAAAGMRPDFA